MDLLALLGSTVVSDWLHRPTLRPMRDKLMKEIIEAPKGTIFKLEMTPIELLNSSGVDEILVKTMLWLRENKDQEKFLYLQNLSSEEEYDHAYNIGKGLSETDVSILVREENGYQLLGSLGTKLVEVLDIVYKHKSVTAREVAEQLDKKLNLASTQLSDLYSMRLIERVEELMPEGGRQFVYKSLF
ncbi:hypothetical protein [Brevibacillus brevis]|uniref:hypothetical protein n=1 Tax=Brevibacillus brevis TaxID=1393 RepID=UPI000D110C4B|nr:hypothetical protein [Brevibacillus brevis]PSJ66272.1 hypothetical protein C7J99_26405 [Brevibacillus brevis]RED21778.1 hypothetical protein DES34_11843 [Brevibacillus brevis]GEC92457.1 hypothetical protein BBR01nite_47880 [Brevibacillus brevis]VEF92641.1 Predicted transcriptional regulator [Brevibacillus brevis]